MPELVFVLCAATSIGCALLLLRGYRRDRTRLLFWSCACFFFLGLSNVLLFVDLVMFPRWTCNYCGIASRWRAWPCSSTG